MLIEFTEGEKGRSTRRRVQARLYELILFSEPVVSSLGRFVHR